MTSEVLSTTNIAAAVLCLTLAWAYSFFFPTRDQAKGPRGLPILGNLFQVPQNRPWIHFAQWKETYGDFISLKIFRRRLFVINSPSVAIDLFEKRSAIYSDRPQRQMAILCGFDQGLLFQNYGEKTRKTRKLLHAELSQTGVNKHRALQEREVLHYVSRIMQSADSLRADTKKLATSVIFMLSYGYRVARNDDPMLMLSDHAMSFLERVVTPNNFLVDSLPILKYLPEWFPGASFQKEAKDCRDCLYKLMVEPYLDVKRKLARGDGLNESFVSRHLEARGASLTDEEDDLLLWTSGALNAGGSHSTVAVIMSFFLCMILHPHAQREAQEELDRVLGKGCLPRLEDRPSLPYIDRLLQEIIRWRPISPLAAHTTAVNDMYNGVFIPAGSVIMANIWAFTRDEDIYKDPNSFDPDRFLDPAVTSARQLVFGFGRRACPGLYLFDNIFWMVIAVTLTTMEILPELDLNGNPIMPSDEYTSGAVSQPLPFRCRFHARYPHSADLLSDAIDIVN